MHNYPSQTLSPIYPYPIVRPYSSQPYYYSSYNEYPSSPLLSRVPYTTTLPNDQYTSSVKYYDDEDAYFFEQQQQHHRHRHHHSHYPNH
jgi:hypothetical protein